MTRIPRALVSLASIVLLLALVPATPAVAADDAWSTPMTVSEAGEDASRPVIAQSGTRLIAAWDRSDGSTDRIEVVSSLDGSTWSEPVRVSDVGERSRSARLATVGGTTVLTWIQSDSGTDRVATSTSTDDGVTWSAPVLISGPDFDASSLDLASSGSGVAAAWTRGDGSDTRVEASSSVDGVTWSAPTFLSTGGENAFDPRIASDGTRWVATWAVTGRFSRIDSATSSDGVTWGAPVTVSPSGGLAPAITSSGSDIVVAWTENDGASNRVYTARTTDGAETWSAPVAVSPAGQPAQDAVLRSSTSSVVVAWRLFTGSGTVIQVATSDDSGESWGTASTVSDPTTRASGHGVAILGQTITVGYRTFPELLTTSSSDGGATWSEPSRLSIEGEDSFNLNLVASGARLLATWTSYQDPDYRTRVTSFTDTDLVPPDPDTSLPTLPDPEPELAATGPLRDATVGVLLAAVLLGTGMGLHVVGRRRGARTHARQFTQA